MSRFARDRRVFFFEEPVFEGTVAKVRSAVCDATGVTVCTPLLPQGLSPAGILQHQRELLDSLINEEGIVQPVTWYYTPMSLEFSNHLEAKLVVYDCMDELKAFAGAPPAMALNEQELFNRAALVFTGGASLYKSKKLQHKAVHLFPSSVDVAHFRKARNAQPDPLDQRSIPHPRIGYAGVIDERMDLCFVEQIAALRSEWQFILLGPVVKISPDILPKLPNIHYLGMKPYADLPAYFSGWDIGMLPFALNESTRYISPTKTPEYLAAGLPAISTAIHDVVKPYGDLGLVGISHTPDEFVSIAEIYLSMHGDLSSREHVDSYLSNSSWDKTWSGMNQLMEKAVKQKSPPLDQSGEAFLVDTALLKGAAYV